jgi:ferritin-like protein
MKSPQEKAKELVDLFYYPTLRWALIHAKECALKCVDEIINVDMLIDEDTYVMTPSYLQYWLEVKKEIEKL